MASAHTNAKRPGPAPTNPEVEYKVCTGCGENKPIYHYSPRKGRPLGVQSRCKPCRTAYNKTEAHRRSMERARWKHRYGPEDAAKCRDWWMPRKYGITPETYDRMVAEQGGVCKICSSPPTDRYKRLVIDHCHETGAIRGLLCNRCNLALGHLGDTREAVQKVLEYLS